MVLSPRHDRETDEDQDFGIELEYDSALEETLHQAEQCADSSLVVKDIEEFPTLSPIEQFRKKGFLSVTDLVGTVWCEVQYDYRLRTSPFLPLSERPVVITSNRGAEISVDQVKVEGKERILRRGEAIHKRLEREIHPSEITVTAVTREDTWGLRLLNMLSALEALLSIGKCRELPVAGFVRGILVIGLVDEVTREPVNSRGGSRQSRSDNQTSIDTYFSSTKSRVQRARTYKLSISDSKTRANGSLPNESDTLAGRLQLMLYKELLDAILVPNTEASEFSSPLPTANPSGLSLVLSSLTLDCNAEFSESFLSQSRPVILSNGLRWGAIEARCLADFISVWERYVDALGLGSNEGEGRTESSLALVYRRAAPLKRKSVKLSAKHRNKKKIPLLSQEDASIPQLDGNVCGENSPIRSRASREPTSLPFSSNTGTNTISSQSTVDKMNNRSPRRQTEFALDGRLSDREEDELAWVLEMNLETEKTHVGRGIAETAMCSSQSNDLRPDLEEHELSSAPPMSHSPKGASSGSIIGRTRFEHDRTLLATHLDSILGYWTGVREPRGVEPHEVGRCAWCEFEEGCEWRSAKALEAWRLYRSRRDQRRSR